MNCQDEKIKTTIFPSYDLESLIERHAAYEVLKCVSLHDSIESDKILKSVVIN
jgi:hypothetical protein